MHDLSGRYPGRVAWRSPGRKVATLALALALACASLALGPVSPAAAAGASAGSPRAEVSQLPMVVATMSASPPPSPPPLLAPIGWRNPHPGRTPR